MNIIDSAVAWAIETANDNSHGYSQQNRWGPDYDCSSFVITAYQNAGLKLREHGATYTGNMRPAFLACGFVDVTTQVGISSGYGLQPGDVLLNYAAHTCMFVGGGKVANCRTSEGNYQAGDQSGNEIRIQSYWDGSPNKWNCVLRYKGPAQATAPTGTGSGTAQAKPEPAKDTEDHTMKLPLLTVSNRFDDYCVLLQALLNVHHWACGGCDGFFGPKTEGAVNKAREFYGMDRTGKCDKDLWAHLLKVG